LGITWATGDIFVIGGIFVMGKKPDVFVFNLTVKDTPPEPLICPSVSFNMPLRPLGGASQPTDWGHPYSLTTANKLSSVMPVVLFPI
jgi:hypothetical protein